MIATLVQNVAGDLRVELKSENPDERAFIKSLGRAGAAGVIVTGSERSGGRTEHYLTLAPSPRVDDEERESEDEDEDEDRMFKDEEKEW